MENSSSNFFNTYTLLNILKNCHKEFTDKHHLGIAFYLHRPLFLRNAAEKVI